MLSLVMKIASIAEKITLLANARYVFYSAIVTTCISYMAAPALSRYMYI